jgi:hypothetical protein
MKRRNGTEGLHVSFDLHFAYKYNHEEQANWSVAYNFPKARERLEELRKNPHKGARQPANGKLSRNQKKDESECVVM